MKSKRPVSYTHLDVYKRQDVDGDFEPKYITIRGKGEILAKLRKEAKKAEDVYKRQEPFRQSGDYVTS